MLKKPSSSNLLDGLTYLSTFITVFALVLIVFFLVREGAQLLRPSLLTSDYFEQKYIASLPEDFQLFSGELPSLRSGEVAIENYGLIVEESIDKAGDPVIRVVHLEATSPLTNMLNKNPSEEGMPIAIQEGMVINRVAYENTGSSLRSRGAEAMAETMNNPENIIRQIDFGVEGGGIRGSIIATLYLIAMTLVVALPVGILTALYFNEFAPKNRVTDSMRSFIEVLTGVPSIIYGLLGIAVFVPITTTLLPTNRSNLVAAALTLAVILLPVIIRTTEESLKTVPNSHRFASLALGANKTQTTFKVVLPQAFSGILTATFLGIGRVIGESAALIFVLGTAIKDQVSILEPATSLAVHIFTVMSNEPANVELGTAIAVIILTIVLLLNVSIKLTVYMFDRRKRSA